uniref:Cytosolic class II small heat shock protein HSP16.9IIa n=1 Tax=Phlegmariurus fordii TaxID=89711 RepID=A0A8J9W0Z4_9TRAC|nr:cytosolic class II small heat shock protein HSP16.9IIa [Phlegmariurus fordii]
MDLFSDRDPLITTLYQFLNNPEENEKGANTPARSYARDRRAMASTAVDVKELPNAYVFIADMPGLKSSDVKVQLENDNVLNITGERKLEDEDKLEGKYLRLERGAGKFMRKFTLPANAKTDGIAAKCQDGVLTVTVPKVRPPEHKTVNISIS